MSSVSFLFISFFGNFTIDKKEIFTFLVVGTLMTIVGWTGSTFFGESTKTISDPESGNQTITVEIPRLMLRAWYPWDSSSSSYYLLTFLFQVSSFKR